MNIPPHVADGGPAAYVGPAGHVGIVGAGPTGAYTLHRLLAGEAPLVIDLFETAATPGPGGPFSPAHNDVAMLANIAGIELPPLIDTLNEWAVRQPATRLAQWGVTADQARDPRAFLPRITIGAYFADQFDMMLGQTGAHRVRLHRRTMVSDIVAAHDAVRIIWADADGRTRETRCDHVVIATGYGNAPHPSASGLPAAEHIAPSASQVGVIGTSLSAIDAAVTVALARGSFEPTVAGLAYVADRHAGRGYPGWQIALFSRGGLLPEADCWVPYPPEPLDIFTNAAVCARVAGRDGDLDRVFDLFARQLAAADPAYATTIDLAQASVDDFHVRYFAARKASDPFVWARHNLDHARQTHAKRHAEPWRAAILQMHAIFGAIVPRLSAGDHARFDRGIKRVFIDNYADVPHTSIERLLALHEAGVLSVHALGPDYRIDHDPDATGAPPWRIVAGDRAFALDALIDARGQAAVALDMLPFPTLRMQLCAFALGHGDQWDRLIRPESGFVVDPQDPALARVHVLAMPFLLRKHPFIQGLVESAAMAKAASQSIDDALDAERGTVTPAARLRRFIAEMTQSFPPYAGDVGKMTASAVDNCMNIG